MITRALSLFLILYALGFIFFSVTLGRPAPEDSRRVDAVVVITGGPGRIEHGLEVLADGKAGRMLVAGADPSVTKPDLVRVFGGQRRLVGCCVDLGSESVDTRSNADEAERWLARRDFDTLRLVTSDWHMRRARYEFTRVLGKDVEVVADAVRTEPSFMTLFAEYNKYLLRRVSVLLEL